MFPRTDGSKTTHRYQFNQLKPCGVCGIDYKDVNIDFTGFAGLHPSCLLDLKGKMRTREHSKGIFLDKT